MPVDGREDRERRGRGPPGSPRWAGTPVFAIGNYVMHDLLGDGVVRKLARPGDEDRKLLFEWVKETAGFARKRRREIFNRWVLPASLKKLRSSPRFERTININDQEDTQQDQMEGDGVDRPPDYPQLAAHEHARAKKKLAAEGSRGRAKVAHISKKTSIPLQQRLLVEFPDTGLSISGSKLF